MFFRDFISFFISGMVVDLRVFRAIVLLLSILITVVAASTVWLEGDRHRPLNESEAREFIDWVNAYRSNVTPTAGDMPYMVSKNP